VDQWAYLGFATRCRVVTGTGSHHARFRFGNAILTRFPILAARVIDLTVASYEPRGAIDADLLIGERVLRVICTHFGLHAAERHQQANRLTAALEEPVPANRRDAHAVPLMGDLNEWRGRRGAIRSLDRSYGPSAAALTFPSWMPVLALGTICADVSGCSMTWAPIVPRSPVVLPITRHSLVDSAGAHATFGTQDASSVVPLSEIAYSKSTNI
jgi:endonuclease/exonuclease/phosphatase family metal-dependent hydrolase